MNNKTISFDLWGTLIKANPKYSEKRIEIIRKYTEDISEDTIKYVFADVKKEFDVLVEKYGVHHNNYTVYSAIFTRLYIHQELWKRIINELEKEFLKNPPIIIDNTLEVLKKLTLLNHNLILISNTLLIPGHILSKALPDLMYYFNIEYFSDEVKLSKPNKNLYSLCYDNKCDNIIHVGDNSITDIMGAKQYGVQAYQINSNNKTILDFYNNIIKWK